MTSYRVLDKTMIYLLYMKAYHVYSASTHIFTFMPQFSYEGKERSRFKKNTQVEYIKCNLKTHLYYFSFKKNYSKYLSDKCDEGA